MTNGTITLQQGILKPATPSTFVTTERSSTAVFQFTASKWVAIYNFGFKADTTFIDSINYLAAGPADETYINEGVTIKAGGSATHKFRMVYKDADSTRSGSIVQIKLNYMPYSITTSIITPSLLIPIPQIMLRYRCAW